MSVNYATRTFSAINFLQFSRKESCWRSFNLGFQLGKKQQIKMVSHSNWTALRCLICTAIYYLQFIISKMHSAENRIQNALSASRLSNQFLTAAQCSHFKIPVNSSLLAASWRLRGCCPSSHQIRTQSSQSAVSTCLNSQYKPTHTLMGGAKYVKHGTWSWSRTNTCALAWRLKYTKYRIFNHVYNVLQSFRWNCWLKGFQSFLPRKQQPKQRRSTGRSRNPHRCRASASVAFHPSVEKSFSSLIQPEVPK